MEDYPRNSFERHVQRTAHMRHYGKTLDRIEHEIKLNHDMTYLRLIVVAADLYATWADEMPEPVIRTEPEVASGEFTAR